MRTSGRSKRDWGVMGHLFVVGLLILLALACGATPARASVGTLAFSDDFSNLDNWGTSMQWGDFTPWGLDSGAYVSAPSCLSHTPYSWREGSEVFTKTKDMIDLTTATTATLRFAASYNTEPNRDFINVYIYPDQVDPWGSPVSTVVAQLSGSTGGVFVSQTIDLSNYAGQKIRLMFRLSTLNVDEHWLDDGVARIDDVSVWKDGVGPPDGGSTDPLPVYRFLNNRYGTHFYTADQAEYTDVNNNKKAEFTYEGISYRVAPKDTAGAIPVHRFLSKKYSYVHFYTANDAEYQNVLNNMKADWTYEGVSYAVWKDPSGTLVPVNRFLNKTYGVHFYTSTSSEYDRAVAMPTYQLEGIGFYVEPSIAP